MTEKFTLEIPVDLLEGLYDYFHEGLDVLYGEIEDGVEIDQSVLDNVKQIRDTIGEELDRRAEIWIVENVKECLMTK